VSIIVAVDVNLELLAVSNNTLTPILKRKLHVLPLSCPDVVPYNRALPLIE
jgi:hypothetical protein